MRGHGQSDYPLDQGAYSEEATVADMAALLDAVGAERAIVGGLSLGGYMSLAFHLAHPERVEALLIIDTGPGYRKDEAREGWNANALSTAERYETEGLARLAGGSAEMRTSSHRNAEGLAKRRARHADPARRAGDRQPADDRRPRRSWWSAPTTRRSWPPRDYMAAKIPGAKKVVIPDAGHAANIDQPEAFNAAVARFPGRGGSVEASERSPPHYGYGIHGSALAFESMTPQRVAEKRAQPLAMVFGPGGFP